MTTPEESDDATGPRGPSLFRMNSHQSNSLPSTPRQLARDGPFDALATMPGAQTRIHSPRSTSSESNRRMFNYNPQTQGCRFMSTQVSRRRMPYSDEAGGAAILAKPSQEPKIRLEQEEDAKLSEGLQRLYERLLPSEDNQSRRDKLLQKLRTVISQEWPGRELDVQVFGSSGNLLYTDESDVDICVIMKDLTTCALAELLHRSGMKGVKCVHAKIRIVKMQDPELDLKCDLNVNNELALTNTHMIKTYIRLDPRVRPLAMIVKYWTRERIINEASGGTLSSYTWTLLLINFLQTRSPPVLPRIATQDSDGRRREDFSDDLKSCAGFGTANTETLGGLFFNFYRRYGYEVDFETSVISVREAKLLSKTEKGWHLATNNRLCVEEPFSTGRNLGNTADDSAWRGLHLELRRAFDLVAEAKDIVSDVCQHYDFLEQPKPQIERPQPASRPVVLTRSLSQSGRSGRGGASYRGGVKHQGRDVHRGPGSNGRRASSAAAFGHNANPIYMGGPAGSYASPEFLAAQAAQQHSQQQVQPINGLHDQLVHIQQGLYARERELRQHAATIAQASGSPASGATGATFTSQSRPPQLNGLQSLGTRSVDDSPATAPLHPQYGYPYVRYNGSHLVFAYPPQQPVNQQATAPNGSSPSMTPTPLRRELQRNQLPSSPGASVRSHSQPARPPGPQSIPASNVRPRYSMMMPSSSQDTRQPHPASSNPPPSTWLVPLMGPNGWIMAPSQSRPREYLGYGFTGTSQVSNQYQSQPLTRATTYDDLRRRSRHTSPTRRQSSLATPVPEPSRSPSPLRDVNGHYDALQSAPMPQDIHQVFTEPDSGLKSSGNLSPLIVNGSYFSAAPSLNGDHTLDERPRRVSDSGGYPQSMFRTWSNVETSLSSESGGTQSQPSMENQVLTDPEHHIGEQIWPKQEVYEHSGTEIPGITASTAESCQSDESSLFSVPTGKAARSTESKSGIAQAPAEESSMQQTSPDAATRSGPNPLRRQSAAGRGNVPALDLGTNVPERPRENAQVPAKVLSPVQETRTPSPTSSRKRDSRDETYMNGANGSASGAGAYAKAAQQHPPVPSRFSSSQAQTGGTKHLEASSAAAAQPRAPLSNATNSNPWQQAGKKGNRRSRGQAELAVEGKSSGGGQPMPANISERKGG